MGVPIQAGQFPLLAAIRRLGPLSIGELAEAVGITQPGVTRGSAPLVTAGYLKAKQATDDQRRRVLSLTRKGHKLMEMAECQVWPRIENAVTDLCGELSGPLLDQLISIEAGLAEKPLDRREGQR